MEIEDLLLEAAENQPGLLIVVGALLLVFGVGTLQLSTVLDPLLPAGASILSLGVGVLVVLAGIVLELI